MDTVLIVVAVILGIGVLGVACYWAFIRYRFSEAPPTTEQYDVRTADGWYVRVCRYRNPKNFGDPVILCHGVAANHWSLISPPGQGLVDTLVARGFDCWALDVRGTRSSRPPEDGYRTDARADDYALQDMPAVIEFVRRQTGREQVHWVGHSMGGMMLYMYLAAFNGDRIASGTTLGSPPGLDHMKLPPMGAVLFVSRLVPPVVEFCMRVGSTLFGLFKMNIAVVPTNWANMNPRVGPRAFYNMVEFLPYPAASQLVGWIQAKKWVIDHGQVDVGAKLGKMDAPLLLVYGAADPFTPEAESNALYDSLPTQDKRLLLLGKDQGCRHDYNHVDLVFSRNGRTEVYEPIAEWIAAHPAELTVIEPVHPMASAHPKRVRAKTKTRVKATAKSVAKKKSATKKKTAKKKPAKKKGAKTKAAKKKPAKKKAAKKKPASTKRG